MTFLEIAVPSRKHLHTKVTLNLHLTYSNQRTNDPVNAHLKSGPTISAKTSFARFDIVLKGQGQLRVIIYINFVGLEYILLHVKFHDHRTICFVGEDFYHK